MATNLNTGATVLAFPTRVSKNVVRAVPKTDRNFSGPVSGEMWKKISSLNSAYKDNFDWSSYDTLHYKFEGNYPRGGILFKTGLKLVNFHSQCSKCHYSLEIDTYGRGCVHNCKYCYAKDQLTLRGYWNNPHPMPIDLTDVRKIFHTVFETEKASKWRNLLEKRIPIRIGSMSDSFMWMDQKFGVTLEFLNILKFYKYPYIIFTRSDLIAQDNYLAALDRDLASIQFSISGESDTLTKLIEPGAPSVPRRLAALKKLNENGFWTAVRINPLLPKYPDGYFTERHDVESRFPLGVPNLNLLDIDNPNNFMGMLKEAKVPSIVVGFVRLNQTAISQMSKATNVELRNFFKPGNYKSSGESHYSDNEIRYYYATLKQSAHLNKIRFSTCYIGNGMKDYFQYQDLWSQKDDCCDSVGNVSGFKTTCQTINWDERFKHASLYKESAANAKRLEEEYESRLSQDAVPLGILKGLETKSGIKWQRATTELESQV